MAVVMGRPSKPARSNASAASRKRKRRGWTSMERALAKVSPRNAQLARADAHQLHTPWPTATRNGRWRWRAGALPSYALKS